MVRPAFFSVSAMILLMAIATPVRGVPHAQSGPESDSLAALAKLLSGKPPTLDPAGARTRAERLAQKFLAEGRWADAGHAERLVSDFALRAGDSAGAIRAAENATRYCRRAGDDKCTAIALNVSGKAFKRSGDLETAMARYRDAALLFAKVSDPTSAAGVRLNTANVQYELGDTEGAITTYRQIERDYPGTAPQFLAFRNEADVLIRLGRYTEAKGAAQRAVTLSRNPKLSFNWTVDPGCSASEVLGVARSHLGDAGGLADLERCVALATRVGTKPEIHYANQALAEALIALKRPAEALPFAQRALSFNDVGSPRDAALTERLAALAYSAKGDSAAAFRLVDQAFETERRYNQAHSKGVVAGALARASLAERQSLLDLITARAAQQHNEDASRLLATVMAGVVLLAIVTSAAIAAFAWLRLRQARAHDAAVSAERTRVARDLHDTLLQGFSGVSMQLGAAALAAEDDPAYADRLRAIATQARHSLEDARNTVWRMRAPIGGKTNLVLLLQTWLDQVRSTTDVRIVLEALSNIPCFDAHTADDLFRFVQEAVTNAMRHGEPDTIEISLKAESSRMAISVRDDGSGFDVSLTSNPPLGHWGIVGMRERMMRVQGEFHIDSSPGAGTHVMGVVPL